MVRGHIHLMSSDSHSLTRSSLSKDGDVRIPDLKRLFKIDLPTDRKRHDPRSFSLNCMPQCTLRAIVRQRCDHIFLSAKSAKREHSASLGPVECYSPLLHDLDFLAVLDYPTHVIIINVMSCLPFQRRPDERTDSLAVIINDRFAQIVREIPPPVLLSSQATYRAAVCY